MVNITNPFLLSNQGETLNVEGWVAYITKDHSVAERQAIREACLFAQQIYQSHQRPSGESYLLHALTVADILANLGMDTEVLIAAILHDVVENNKVLLAEIEKRFGKTIMQLIDGVTRMRLIEQLNEQSTPAFTEDQTEGLRKMLLTMAEDIRVVLIKLADRLHDMRVLRHLPEEKRLRTARKTLELFAPLANRLGIWQIKWELEDLSLRYLEPATYQQMARLLDERRVDREKYIQQIIETLSKALSQTGIQADISGRPKHIYSIWRKMQRKNLNFEQIFDILAVRVIVNTVSECYTALGIIHTKWQPLRGEFDDYIANPKSNSYQSLHTAVIGPEQKIFEVQIRTYYMHHHAEFGVASHWRYKEENTPHDTKFEKRIAWLRQILQSKEEDKEEGNDSSDLFDRFKSEISEDRVYVLSPRGEIIDLPQGATPLDFAYCIHTQLGHCCRGAKINNRIVPLTYTLKNGDQVEILASKEEKPSRDWLILQAGYLKTSRARAKVRQWLKKQDNKEHVQEGRLLLERMLRRLNLIKEANFERVASQLRFKTAEELFASLGRGEISLTQIANTFNEQLLPKPPHLIPVVAKPTYHQGDIYIKGVGGLLTQIARCCCPVPYDPIIGYVTKSKGVMVHHRDCPNALRWQYEENERLIEVAWSQSVDKEPQVYPVDIQIEAYDRTGLLGDICHIASHEKVNILATNTNTNKANNSVKMTLTFEVTDVDQLTRTLMKIDNLPNVLNVRRKN